MEPTSERRFLVRGRVLMLQKYIFQPLHRIKNCSTSGEVSFIAACTNRQSAAMWKHGFVSFLWTVELQGRLRYHSSRGDPLSYTYHTAPSDRSYSPTRVYAWGDGAFISFVFTLFWRQPSRSFAFKTTKVGDRKGSSEAAATENLISCYVYTEEHRCKSTWTLRSTSTFYALRVNHLVSMWSKPHKEHYPIPMKRQQKRLYWYYPH